MGNTAGKSQADKIQSLQAQTFALQKNFQGLQQSFRALPQTLAPRTDFLAQLERVEENSQKVSNEMQTLSSLNEQLQQCIEDLEEKHKQYHQDSLERQVSLEETLKNFNEKFDKYDQELLQVKSKSMEVQEILRSQEEIIKPLGIIKTDNMIKKEPKTTGKRGRPSKREAQVAKEPQTNTTHLTRRAAALLKNKESEQEGVSTESVTGSESNEMTMAMEEPDSSLKSHENSTQFVSAL